MGDNILEIISSVLLVIGSFFIFLSGVGVLKLPDIFMRMSATTKATTLGVGLVMLATAVAFYDYIETITISLIIIAFLFITAPVSAHLIGRAAYFNGIPLWDKTVINELKSDPGSEHKIKSE